MISEFDELLGFGADESDESGMDDYASSLELLGAVEDDMDDEDFERAVDEDTELLGRAFGSLRSRIKKRRKLRRKFKNLPRRKRRKLIRKIMLKSAAAGAAIPLMRLVPGSRIALAVMKRRARKRGMSLSKYLKSRRAKRRKKRKVRRVKRVARRSRRRSARKAGFSPPIAPVSDSSGFAPVITPSIAPQAERIEDIAERENQLMPVQPAKKSGFAKLLPLAAAAAAIPFLLG